MVEALLLEYTKSESLRGHFRNVATAMLWYAAYYDQTPEQISLWEVTGLLHDFDYEQFPEPVSPDGHPYKGCSILRELGYPNEIIESILGHADYTNTPRTKSQGLRGKGTSG